jgi:sugar/nucleoside kinase (ribokinase family)
MSQILVVGSVALDTVETPHGVREDILGGSATHFSLSAAHFAPVRLVAVVGRDFPKAHLELLASRRVDTSGVETADGRTFRWHGRYDGDMNRAETVAVQLNVLEKFRPRVPEAFAATPYVLLGNSSPRVQREVLDQLRAPRLVMLDTMNLWISTERAELLEILPRVGLVCINYEEALQLAGARNASTAIRRILEAGARALIVKRGEHGATLATRDFMVSVPAYPTQRITDPTGAGDSFAGGVLGYLAQCDAEEPPLRRALVYGTVMGSLAVEEFGTEGVERATRAEVDARARTLLEMVRV